MDEQIGGPYRRHVRIIYKVVSREVVNNLLGVFRKRNINGKLTIIFVKHCEEKDSRGLAVGCLELQRGHEKESK